MLFRRKTTITPPPAEIAGVRVRASTRARRMSLRIEARSGDVVLVFPPRGSVAKAVRFIEKNRDWIEKQHAKKVHPRAVAPGMTLSVLGRDYTVTHAKGRGVTRFEGDRIVVHGGEAHLRRRLRDFLKKEALHVLTVAVREKTDSLGLKMTAIRVIDPKTRWGSCGPDGRIMFSWRLILAPPEVMDYVVAHEVAHRVHMNHSRKFWALCASLTTDAAYSRRWLRTHGQVLMTAL
jgi:predicted metal-dependent hydrolase